MFSYKTVDEKAAEWGVTARYIQNLCRDGKIEGAEKRAGAWFIPENAPNPAKHSKADDSKPFDFVGTKKKIFDNSVRLFTQKGFENVSMNDIADMANIRQSAVYNHFASKQQILDTIYGYYHYYSLSRRPSPSDVDIVLQNGSLMDIIMKGFIYEFEQNALDLMSDITKIIVQRASTDVTASELFQSLMLEEGINFVERGLNKAVEIGRLAPFDTHAVAVLINCIRLYTLFCWLVCPQNEVHEIVVRDEESMYEHVTALLTDLAPPAGQ